MKFNRRFFDSSVNFRKISNERFVLSFVISLATAYTIYAFFYVLREAFRVLSFGFENFSNILSESDRNFYNIFFAGLSFIFANSIFINLLLSKPQQVVSPLNPKRKRILNDQIFLSFNFSYWFTKIGLVFGVFSMCCMDFNFLPYFKFSSYLLLGVLYLESWKNLSCIFKKNRFKIQLLHLLFMMLLVFGLSRINIIDYKAIDALSISQNPIIDLPHSDFYSDRMIQYDWEVSFKLQLNENNDLEINTENKNKIALEDVASFIEERRIFIREELMPFLAVRISASKNMPIKYIKMFEAELYSINQRKIVYDVHNDNLMASRFEKIGIDKMITESFFEIKLKKDIPIPPVPNYTENYQFNDTVNVSIQKMVRINGEEISKDKLVDKFKKYIKPKTLVLYMYNEDIVYQDYITVLSSHFAAAHRLRENEQTIFRAHEYDYNESFRKEQTILKVKYPIIIKENLIKKDAKR
ncbi:hypothetical protein ACFQ1R_07380 [Mariniflexile jejuense]|uniref:Uncharacterized protein n=1 Tax=Mariniflexile jejuense TaxID=1173582 RepID=A0ABW3JKJ5_9FLAO